MENTMNTNVVHETPVYSYETCWAYDYPGDESGIIELYADEVKNAPIGKVWSVSDVDKFPNANYEFEVSVKKVYQDENGVLLIEHVDDYRDSRTAEAIWVEFHK